MGHDPGPFPRPLGLSPLPRGHYSVNGKVGTVRDSDIDSLSADGAQDTRQMFQQELTESQFQLQVTEYASMRGWEWMHIQKALNERGYWRTPITGSLGRGWPDLVLVRKGRLLFVELKTKYGKPTGLQSEVLGVLGMIPSAEVYVWRPGDWVDILELLR